MEGRYEKLAFFDQYLAFTSKEVEVQDTSTTVDHSYMERRTYAQWQTNMKSYYDLSIGAMFNDQWPWTAHNPEFKVTPIFDVEYVIKVQDRLIGLKWITIARTYSCPTHNPERPLVTDLQNF